MAWLGMPAALYLLLPAVGLAVSGDVLRAYSPRFNRFIRRIFGSMMRTAELPPLGRGVVINGATWVLVSALLLALVFPLRVVLPAFTMFMISDAVAAVVGRRWGRHRWGRTARTVEGSAAFLVSGLAVMACFPHPIFGVGAVATAVACVAEALPGPGNDNVRVPFAAALTVVLLEWLLFGQPIDLFPMV
jgi:dolichol kinase